MSFKNTRSQSRYYDADTVEVKSKLDAEFRRFSLDRRKQADFEDFYKLLSSLHSLEDPFVILYPDQYGDLLPINNDDNYQKALSSSKPVLRLQIQRKGESYLDQNGYAAVTMRKRNPIISKLIAQEPRKANVRISQPEDFRRVSAIIDVDIVPDTCRRVKLMKNGQDKPLGFYIRDGTSLRATHNGIEKVPGIFISRLVPGGLAESTGLIAVNDEVLEVNGIGVEGKSLDQVTDMMVANSCNLIITVKPVNQRNTLARPSRSNRQSQLSTLSASSSHSRTSQDSDEIRDYTSKDISDQLPDEEDEDDEVCHHMEKLPAHLDDDDDVEDEDDDDEYQDTSAGYDVTTGAYAHTSGVAEVSDGHLHHPKPVMSL